jgi:hypothetical protein
VWIFPKYLTDPLVVGGHLGYFQAFAGFETMLPGGLLRMSNSVGSIPMCLLLALLFTGALELSFVPLWISPVGFVPVVLGAEPLPLSCGSPENRGGAPQPSIPASDKNLKGHGAKDKSLGSNLETSRCSLISCHQGLSLLLSWEPGSLEFPNRPLTPPSPSTAVQPPVRKN